MQCAVLAQAGQDDEGRVYFEQIASDREQREDADGWVELKKEIERGGIEAIGPQAAREFPGANETQYDECECEQVRHQVEEIVNGLEAEQTAAVGDESEREDHALAGDVHSGVPVGLGVQGSKQVVKLKIAVDGEGCDASGHTQTGDDVETNGFEVETMLIQVLVTERYQ